MLLKFKTYWQEQPVTITAFLSANDGEDADLEGYEIESFRIQDRNGTDLTAKVLDCQKHGWEYLKTELAKRVDREA